MGKLISAGLTSLDGYLVDREGKFDWAAPDAEVHGFVNELERKVDTYLYGRRLYETMVAWADMPLAGEPAEIRDYAEIWQSARKIVYSTTLAAVASARTELERHFDPAAVRRLKADTDGEIAIGGAGLAGVASRAGLIDEYRLFLSPVLVGGGTAFLPADVRTDLELLDERRFGNGTVYLRYAVSETAR